MVESMVEPNGPLEVADRNRDLANLGEGDGGGRRGHSMTPEAG